MTAARAGSSWQKALSFLRHCEDQARILEVLRMIVLKFRLKSLNPQTGIRSISVHLAESKLVPRPGDHYLLLF